MKWNEKSFRNGKYSIYFWLGIISRVQRKNGKKSYNIYMNFWENVDAELEFRGNKSKNTCARRKFWRIADWQGHKNRECACGRHGGTDCKAAECLCGIFSNGNPRKCAGKSNHCGFSNVQKIPFIRQHPRTSRRKHSPSHYRTCRKTRKIIKLQKKILFSFWYLILFFIYSINTTRFRWNFSVQMNKGLWFCLFSGEYLVKDVR